MFLQCHQLSIVSVGNGNQETGRAWGTVLREVEGICLCGASGHCPGNVKSCPTAHCLEESILCQIYSFASSLVSHASVATESCYVI